MIGWLTQDFFNLPVVGKAKLWHRLQIHLLADCSIPISKFPELSALRFGIRAKVTSICDKRSLATCELQSDVFPRVDENPFTFTNL